MLKSLSSEQTQAWHTIRVLTADYFEKTGTGHIKSKVVSDALVAGWIKISGTNRAGWHTHYNFQLTPSGLKHLSEVIDTLMLHIRGDQFLLLHGEKLFPLMNLEQVAEYLTSNNVRIRTMAKARYKILTDS